LPYRIRGWMQYYFNPFLDKRIQSLTYSNGVLAGCPTIHRIELAEDETDECEVNNNIYSGTILLTCTAKRTFETGLPSSLSHLLRWVDRTRQVINVK